MTPSTTECPLSSKPQASRTEVPSGASASYLIRWLSIPVLALLAGVAIGIWFVVFPVSYHGLADFRALYTAGYMVRTGQARELYNYQAQHRIQNQFISRLPVAFPFDQPACESLLFAPLSLLSYRAAYLAFLVLNLGFLGLAFVVLRPKLKRLGAVYRWLPAALFLVFLPTSATLLQGQDTILLFLILVSAMAFLDAGRDGWAGLALGLGVFRFQIVLPIVLLLALWRHWRLIRGFVVSASALAVGSVLMVGFWPYARILLALSMGLTSHAQEIRMATPLAKMPNLEGLLFGLLGHNAWLLPLSAASSIIVLAIAARAKRDRFLIAIVAALLVSYHSFVSDMVALLIPISVTFERSLRSEGPLGLFQDKLRLGSAALVFICPVLLFSAPEKFHLAALIIATFFAALMLEQANAPAI